MATINWHDHRTLKQHMLAQHGDFNVFQLMRLLLCKAATNLPMEKRLRFKADLSAAFPASEFSRLRVQGVATETGNESSVDEVIEITSANFCIASVLGPLPEPFTEWVRDLVAERVPAMADFLDIFNQRINVLRFELKQKQTLALNSLAPGRTDVAQDLAALMGLATPSLAQQVPLPPRAWLGLAGLLANRRKNAATAVHVLTLVLQAKVKLTPFVGGWQTIHARDTTKLGLSNQRLGQQSLLGQRVWDQHARIRLDIATLSYSAACELLPPNQLELLTQNEYVNRLNVKDAGSHFAKFSSLMRLLLDDLVDCEIVIQVIEETIPVAVLGSAEQKARIAIPRHESSTTPGAHQKKSMRLGQTAWLKSHTSIKKGPNPIRFLLGADDMRRAS